MTGPFLATQEVPSPVTTIQLYSVSDAAGRLRPGMLCFIPTHVRVISDTMGPLAWKREFPFSLEYEFLVSMTIDEEKFLELLSKLNAIAGQTITLVSCDVIINEIEIPGTLDNIRSSFIAVPRVTGDVIWSIRLSAARKWALEGRLDSLLASNTGLLLPTRVTITGKALSIRPPIVLQVMPPLKTN